jgi:hypothetical protein
MAPTAESGLSSCAGLTLVGLRVAYHEGQREGERPRVENKTQSGACGCLPCIAPERWT